MPESNIGRHLESRLVVAETQISKIEESVLGIREAVDKFATDVRIQIGTLSERISAGKQTSWPTIAAFMAIMISLGAIIQTVHNAELRRLEDRIAIHDRTLPDVSYQRGRNDSARERNTMDINEIKESIKDIEARQKESIRMDAEQNARLMSLEKRN
jgi:hypothetical protein